MRKSFTLCLPIAVVTILGLGLSAVSLAQDKDKDAIIAEQKREIEILKKELEERMKADRTEERRQEAYLALFKQVLAQVAKSDQDMRQLQAEQNSKLLEALLQAQQAKKLADRLVDEAKLLAKNLAEREALVVKLEADHKTARVLAANAENVAKARQAQNEALQKQVQELTRRLAKFEKNKEPEQKPQREPADPNPPNALVNGKIEKLDGDLVQISLGKDRGVTKDHTLDVYRLQPEPKYLGMIRIVEAFERTSVGRLVPAGNSALRPALKVGDQVTSKLK